MTNEQASRLLSGPECRTIRKYYLLTPVEEAVRVVWRTEKEPKISFPLLKRIIRYLILPAFIAILVISEYYPEQPIAKYNLENVVIIFTWLAYIAITAIIALSTFIAHIAEKMNLLGHWAMGIWHVNKWARVYSIITYSVFILVLTLSDYLWTAAGVLVVWIISHAIYAGVRSSVQKALDIACRD